MPIPAFIGAALICAALFAGPDSTRARAVRQPPSDSSSPAQQSVRAEPDSGVVVGDEELLYEVSWTFVKLGTVRMKTLHIVRQDSIVRYSAAAYIDSYDGVPLVDLHAINYTDMDSAFTSRGARAFEKKEQGWWGIRYLPTHTPEGVIVEETWQSDLHSAPYKSNAIDTFSVDLARFEDSFSLVYFARAHARTHETLTVPVAANGKLGSATFTFADAKGSESIDPVEYPVRVAQFDGKLDLEGIFGLTGDFKGWFSDDDAAVPIKAQLKVILGNVNIELKSWTRKGWVPPR